MDVIIYVATAINGEIMLATAGNYHTPPELLHDCVTLAHQTSNMVIGYNTYELFFSNPGAKEAFKDVDVVVLSSKEIENGAGITFVKNADAAIAFLKEKGHAKVFVAGGSHTYYSFINGGYANELYINYIPVLAGGGTPLVNDATFFKTYNLTEVKKIGTAIVQVHYQQA